MRRFEVSHAIVTPGPPLFVEAPNKFEARIIATERLKATLPPGVEIHISDIRDRGNAAHQTGVPTLPALLQYLHETRAMIAAHLSEQIDDHEGNNELELAELYSHRRNRVTRALDYAEAYLTRYGALESPPRTPGHYDQGQPATSQEPAT